MKHVDSPTARAQHHAVRFYENDRSLARIVVDFLQEGFDGGHPGIVVATSDQRFEIARELKSRSFDLLALERSHDLLLLDAEQTLSTFMTNGKPNPRKFRNQICGLLEQACRGRTSCTVRVFGQMVDVLWQRGERDAAIQLETLWNHLVQTAAFSLLCGYAMGNFYKDAGFEDVCAQHTHVVAADGTATPAAGGGKHRRRLIERRERR
jgi:hypothetical protein